MIFQTIILAAGLPKSPESNFSKCNFPVDETRILLEFAIDKFKTSNKIIVALNNSDYKYFKDHSFQASPSLVNISRPTQGALATAGMCLDLLADNTPIVISAVDGVCIGIIEDFLHRMSESDADGGAIIFPSINPGYSYVRLSHSYPVEFAEKVRISEFATAGVFYFKNKVLLSDSILWAILNQIKHEDVYYLSSAMNKFIFEGKKVVLFETAEDNYFRFSTENEAIASRDRLEKRIGQGKNK